MNDARAGHAAQVTLDCGSAAVAAAVVGALQPEVRDGPEGSVVEASTQGACAVLSISAPDLSALRASLQSLLRLAEAARQTASLR